MNIFAVDAGGTAIKHALVNEQGQIMAKDSFPTPRNSLKELLTGLQAAAEYYQQEFGALAGAGFSFPGSVDEKLGTIHNIVALPYLKEIPLSQDLSAALGLRVAIENDANCAALGENWTGAARAARDVCFIVCGTGVGGALLHDGEVLHGKHFLCGELGFMRLPPAGRVLDREGSVSGLVQRVAQEKGLPAGSLDGEKVFALAEQGDIIAKKQIDYMYRALAYGIVNAQYLFDPDIFLIGGAISACPYFVPSLKGHVMDLIGEVPAVAVEPDIVACQHGNDANLLGAARHFLQAAI